MVSGVGSMVTVVVVTPAPKVTAPVVAVKSLRPPGCNRAEGGAAAERLKLTVAAALVKARAGEGVDDWLGAPSSSTPSGDRQRSRQCHRP